MSNVAVWGDGMSACCKSVGRLVNSEVICIRAGFWIF